MYEPECTPGEAVPMGAGLGMAEIYGGTCQIHFVTPVTGVQILCTRGFFSAMISALRFWRSRFCEPTISLFSLRIFYDLASADYR